VSSTNTAATPASTSKSRHPRQQAALLLAPRAATGSSARLFVLFQLLRHRHRFSSVRVRRFVLPEKAVDGQHHKHRPAVAAHQRLGLSIYVCVSVRGGEGRRSRSQSHKLTTEEVMDGKSKGIRLCKGDKTVYKLRVLGQGKIPEDCRELEDLHLDLVLSLRHLREDGVAKRSGSHAE